MPRVSSRGGYSRTISTVLSPFCLVHWALWIAVSFRYSATWIAGQMLFFSHLGHLGCPLTFDTVVSTKYSMNYTFLIPISFQNSQQIFQRVQYLATPGYCSNLVCRLGFPQSHVFTCIPGTSPCVWKGWRLLTACKYFMFFFNFRL
jgi:hypothetical protein